MVNFLNILLWEDYFELQRDTNEARRAYWDAHKRLFKLVAIMKELSIIKRNIHRGLKILILSSPCENNVLLVRVFTTGK